MRKTFRKLINMFRKASLCDRGYHWPKVVWLLCSKYNIPDECRYKGQSLFMRCDWCEKVAGPICDHGRSLPDPIFRKWPILTNTKNVV